jgi:hypothetical protein
VRWSAYFTPIIPLLSLYPVYILYGRIWKYFHYTNKKIENLSIWVPCQIGEAQDLNTEALPSSLHSKYNRILPVEGIEADKDINSYRQIIIFKFLFPNSVFVDWPFLGVIYEPSLTSG